MGMPYLLVSDIHGSQDGLLLVRKAAEHFHAEGILSAGDQCPESTDISLWSGITSVRGNCDRFYEYDSMPFPPLSRELTIYGRRVVVTHGDRMWADDFDMRRGDIFVSGHTHVPVLKEEDGIYFVNPGSPSRPRSSAGPTAALLEAERLSIFSLLDFTLVSSLDLSSS